jgi:hypothetical protein
MRTIVAAETAVARALSHLATFADYSIDCAGRIAMSRESASAAVR